MSLLVVNVVWECAVFSAKKPEKGKPSGRLSHLAHVYYVYSRLIVRTSE